jgi:hypothetical protein
MPRLSALSELPGLVSFRVRSLSRSRRKYFMSICNGADSELHHAETASPSLSRDNSRGGEAQMIAQTQHQASHRSTPLQMDRSRECLRRARRRSGFSVVKTIWSLKQASIDAWTRKPAKRRNNFWPRLASRRGKERQIAIEQANDAILGFQTVSLSFHVEGDSAAGAVPLRFLGMVVIGVLDKLRRCGCLSIPPCRSFPGPAGSQEKVQPVCCSSATWNHRRKQGTAPAAA